MATYGIPFFPASIAVHVVGLVLLALTLTWVISYRNGVSLFSSDVNQIFNVGLLLLVVAIFVCDANSTLRVFDSKYFESF
jgi:hypothetical protein